MIEVEQLEFHIAHICNFQCDGCTHYSNYGINSVLSFEEGSKWIDAWKRRITPSVFKILGGEPTLNPDMLKYLTHIADAWPKTRRILTTNGAQLNKFPTLPEVLAETNTELMFTFHSNENNYIRDNLPKIRELSEQSRKYGFKFYIPDGRFNWSKTYTGYGKGMKPYKDNDPRASWFACISKVCKQLHDNRLWKCPCIAYLNLIEERMGLNKDEDWLPYLKYKGLGLDASDAEIKKMFAAEDEFICGMCPAGIVHVDKKIRKGKEDLR